MLFTAALLSVSCATTAPTTATVFEPSPAPIAQSGKDGGKKKPDAPAPKKDDKPKTETKDDKGKSGGAAKTSGDALEALLQARGLTKGANGDWLDADEAKNEKEGWTRQDLEWVAPADADKLKEDLWKCGDQWLKLDEANEYHAKIGQWWRLRGKNFDVYTTCKRDTAMKVLAQIDGTADQMVRILGRTPPQRPVVLVLNSSAQYNEFATGDGTTSPDLRGLSSTHGAFFAELWLEPLKHGYSGSGVCYWDESNPTDQAFSPYYARHAAGQSFCEALDPSVNTLSSMGSKRSNAKELADAFWAEKKLPQWFRYGAAEYVERYLLDPTAKDPKALRTWSVTNITNKGGLDPLKKIWGFEFSGDAQADGKLMNECGLIVAFAIDGGVKSITEKHDALKAALKSGKDVDKAAVAFEDEVKKNEAKLREFAGL